MTAELDTLRQAIAGEIGAWGTRGNEYRPLADAVLAVVMADPSVARRFAIADAVDAEADMVPDVRMNDFACGYCTAIQMILAAGKTT